MKRKKNRTNETFQSAESTWLTLEIESHMHTIYQFDFPINLEKAIKNHDLNSLFHFNSKCTEKHSQSVFKPSIYRFKNVAYVRNSWWSSMRITQFDRIADETLILLCASYTQLVNASLLKTSQMTIFLIQKLFMHHLVCLENKLLFNSLVNMWNCDRRKRRQICDHCIAYLLWCHRYLLENY